MFVKGTFLNQNLVFNKAVKVFMLCLLLLTGLSVVSCNVNPFTVNPGYKKNIDKTLIVKPYTPAFEKERVYTLFGIKEFTKKDEDSFYKSLVDSIKKAEIFKEVIVTKSDEEAMNTKGNIYLRVNNNAASIWTDDNKKWHVRFSTTISIGVKNITYFYNVYDETETDPQSPANLKKNVMEKAIKKFFKDLKNAKLEREINLPE